MGEFMYELLILGLDRYLENNKQQEFISFVQMPKNEILVETEHADYQIKIKKI